MFKSRYAAFVVTTALLLVESSAAQPKTRNITVNGTSFAYVDRGSGPLVILIHGSMGDYREWSNQIEPLARHHRVIAYSRRYHWPNALPTDGADAKVERQADDLAEIIKSLGLPAAHLVGHSYGGLIALVFSLKYPEMVRRLVLVEPAVSSVLDNFSGNDAAVKQRQAFREEIGKAFQSGDAERIVRTALANYAPGEFENAPTETREMYMANTRAFTLDFNSPRPTLGCTEIQKIGAPALVLAGSRSPLLRTAQAVAQCLKASNLVTIPHGTHHIQLDRAQEFNEAVLAFLKQESN
jgi:pimeloyl-ACP methyl ester carboxylesterase